MTVSEIPRPEGRRVRLVAAQLHLQLVADDGHRLEPLQVQPIQLTANDWDTFDLGDVIAQVEQEINGG